MNEEQCMLNSQISWEGEDLKFGSVRFSVCVCESSRNPDTL